jgi:hypothetical protein
MPILSPFIKLLSNKWIIAFFMLITAIFFYKAGYFRIPFLNIKALEAIPLNSPLIFQTKQPIKTINKWRTQFYSAELQGIQFVYKWVSDIESYNSVFEKTNSFKQIINTAELTAGAQWAGNNGFEWLFVLDKYEGQFEISDFINELKNYTLNLSTFRNQAVFTVLKESQVQFAIAQHKQLIILARKTNIVESALEQIDNINSSVLYSPDFKNVQLNPNDTNLNVYLNFKDLPILLNTLSPNIPKPIAMLNQWNWWGASFITEKDNIKAKGNLYPNPQAVFWNKLSQQNSALSPTIHKLLPDNTALAAYLSVSSFKSFYHSVKNTENIDFETYILPFINDEFLYFITNPNSANLQSDKFVAFRCPNDKIADNLLAAFGKKFGQLQQIEYQNFVLKQLASQNILQPLFGDTLNPLQNPFYTTVDNFVILANSAAALQLWVEKYNFNQTLIHNTKTAAAVKSLVQNNVFALYINPQLSLSVAKICSYEPSHSFLEEQFVNLYPFSPILIQFKANYGSFFCTLSSAFIPDYQKEAADYSLTVDSNIANNPNKNLNQPNKNLNQPKDSFNYANNNLNKSANSFVAWRTELKYAIKSAPQVLSFAKERKYYISAVDTAQNLYFFDQSGNLLWSKQLESTLLGSIYPYDFYQNGDVKLLFCTEKFIYILNTDGSVFKQIPLISKAVVGLLLIEYNKKGFIFVGCADNNIYGYDKNGRPLVGWNPKKAVGKLATAPAIIYDNNIPYVVLQTKANKLTIYNIEAKMVGTSINLENPLSYFQTDQNANRIAIGLSSGKIMAVNNKSKSFALAPADKLTKSPQFIYVNLVGDTRKDYLRYSNGLISGYYYDDKNKFVAFLNGILKEKPTELFEIVSPIDVFSQIGGLSKTTQQIYLYDKAANLRNGFPLSGSTKFGIYDLLGDKSETLIVGLQNAIIAYKLPTE